MGRKDEERKQFRPYRNFVRVVLFTAIAVLWSFMLRGIIGHLDRMPSADQFDRPGEVDVRALRACGDDLIKLEIAIRKLAAKRLTRLPPYPEAAEDPWDALDRTRLQVVARCHLDRQSDDPAHQKLHDAAHEIERLIRAYALAEDRHENEVVGHSTDALEAVSSAHSILKTREN